MRPHNRPLTFLTPLLPGTSPLHKSILPHKMSIRSTPPCNPSLRSILRPLRDNIPPLSPAAHKGQSGRICTIGGSVDYTGAPYFCAISSMLVGADLSTIICPSEAVIPIKSYSPDVIVSACMHDPQAFANILSRQHVIVIGPGLGRCEASVNMVISCLDVLKQLDDMPLVMDADALWCISQSEIIRHKLITLTSCHRHIFLTPNIPELLRLQTVCKCTSGAQVATHLGVTMIEKGETDVITSAFEDSCVSVNNIGSKKRVGGLGDILSGVVATFIAWYIVLPSSTFHSGASKTNHVATYAAAAACFVTREAARLAYEENGRGLVASQVPAFLSRALQHALDITEENN